MSNTRRMSKREASKNAKLKVSLQMKDELNKRKSRK